jgi:hypothetical protein
MCCCAIRMRAGSADVVVRMKQSRVQLMHACTARVRASSQLPIFGALRCTQVVQNFFQVDSQRPHIRSGFARNFEPSEQGHDCGRRIPKPLDTATASSDARNTSTRSPTKFARRFIHACGGTSPCPSTIPPPPVAPRPPRQTAPRANAHWPAAIGDTRSALAISRRFHYSQPGACVGA